MLNNTQRIAELIYNSDKKDFANEIQVARKCLLDYLACIESSKSELAVKGLSEALSSANGLHLLIGQNIFSTAERSALFNGFAAHYLDLDDVQSNLRGHASVVIFSALLAIAANNIDMSDLLFAYVIGLEVDGLIGEQINPHHKLSGYHTTATIGGFGAVAAIGKLSHLSIEEITKLFSFVATQSAGLGLEAGSDTKPLHAGLAARNAVQSFQMLKSGLSTNMDVFNYSNGWFQTVANQPLDLQLLTSHWLNPPQITNPGIWFKQIGFCSAAMSGYDAAKNVFNSGIQITDIQKIILHFRPGEDKILRYRTPKDGQEGKFSIEYIVWSVIKKGIISNDDFDSSLKLTEFLNQNDIQFVRVNDLSGGSADDRIIKLEVIKNDDQRQSFEIDHPKGSPRNPVDIKTIMDKLNQALNKQSNAIDNAFIGQCLGGKYSDLRKLISAL